MVVGGSVREVTSETGCWVTQTKTEPGPSPWNIRPLVGLVAEGGAPPGSCQPLFWGEQGTFIMGLCFSPHFQPGDVSFWLVNNATCHQVLHKEYNKNQVKPGSLASLYTVSFIDFQGF